MVDIKAALSFIDPASLDYDEWLRVGMGLKEAANDGYAVSWRDWDDWSKTDIARYSPGVCEKKWNSFHGGKVSKSTLIHYAQQNGFKVVSETSGLEWDDEIDDGIPPQEDRDFLIYLRALFDREDQVSVVVHSQMDSKGKFFPADSGFNASAKKLISDFIKYKGEMEKVVGDYNHEAGAWIRINPVDGQGVRNENITSYRYTLIESDKTSIEEQIETIYKLRLPCAAIVYSGGKSVHAVVKIEAEDLEEYERRVQFLHKTLEKQGFPVDKQNKNPSRLSRLPGVVRGKERQYLIDVNTGYGDFATWQEYVENGFLDVELPEIRNFKDVLENMPELAPELIEGVLRQGHKMLLAGSSKAGKSFALIELAVAFAEGKEWFGWKCQQSKVLYINLEIDEASFMHRVKNVYDGLGLKTESPENLRIWSLRGKAQPMQKLTPKIIKRIKAENYDVVILDPVYKVQSGDENAAGDIAAFTNEFDRLTTELDVSLIYCHHHSKGNQGGKRAIDRASGSGVFARDPDAILDMIELDNSAYQSSERYRDCSAWRIEGTLREFPPFEPVNVFFKFPVHEVDTKGLLDNAEYRDYGSRQEKRPAADNNDTFDVAFECCSEDGVSASMEEIERFYGVKREATRKKMYAHNKKVGWQEFRIENDKIIREDGEGNG